MRLLIAEDEVVSRRMLEVTLSKWGFQVTVAANGREAWEILQEPEPPPIVVLDWLMPEMDGIEVTRRVRLSSQLRSTYVLLLTARNSKEEMVVGLEAGADDYVAKPFEPAELRARIKVGERIVRLQSELAGRVRELETAMNQVRVLHGLLPMCSYCKKIRDDKNYWHQVEGYLSSHSQVQFSHGICPECIKRLEEELDTQIEPCGH